MRHFMVRPMGAKMATKKGQAGGKARAAKWVNYRIIYVDDGTPCHWQLQRRHWLFFWHNACGSVSSATTAANEMLRLMKVHGRDDG